MRADSFPAATIFSMFPEKSPTMVLIWWIETFIAVNDREYSPACQMNN